ncbi:MAG: type II secretion system protein, partial [Pseudomonadota bacterium]
AGVTLLEMLVVLGILSLATTAAFGLMRRAPAVAPSPIEQAAVRVSQQRLQAREASGPRVIETRVLGGPEACGSGSATFFPDGSVLAEEGLCLMIDGEEAWFTIDPLNGRLEPKG